MRWRESIPLIPRVAESTTIVPKTSRPSIASASETLTRESTPFMPSGLHGYLDWSAAVRTNSTG